MALSSSESRQVRHSARRARLAIFLQVALAMALATAAVVLVTWLAEQRGFRLRRDMTSGDENTLDPVSIAVIAKLPDDVAIDVFFRPAEFPYDQSAAVAQERMRKILRRAKDESAGHIGVEEHDLSDPNHLGARTENRKVELKVLTIEPGGLLVVSSGARREIVHLQPDVVDIDPGNQDQRMGPVLPAHIVNFRGEEALMSALLKVTQGTAKKVVFTQGHGEPDLEGAHELDLGVLKGELEADGFTVEGWDGARKGTIPADCNLLAIIGPEQAFSSAEYAQILAFVESGGHLVAAPGERPIEGENSLVALLAQVGVKVRARGVVAHPWPTASGQWQYGIEQCGDVVVDASGMAKSPITEPLRRVNQRVFLWHTHVLERGSVPTGGRVLELLWAPQESWYELPAPGTDDKYDWLASEDAERGRFAVAMQSFFPPRLPARDPDKQDATSRAESRVAVIGASAAFVNARVENNHDFLLNTFNWLEGRDYRVKVSHQSTQARRIDVAAPGVLSSVHRVAVVILPLVCLALGLCTAWARRRR